MRSRVGRLASVVAGGVALLVVGALAIGLGVRGGGEGEGERAGAGASSAEPVGELPSPTRPGSVTASAAARAPTGLELAAGAREVVVVARTPDTFLQPVTLDGIDRRVVLRVRAFGFEPDGRGRVEQCIVTDTVVARCGNRFPVRFGADGVARFQYLVGDRYLDPSAGEPLCGAPTRCIVRITDGSADAVVHTVFGGAAPRSEVTLTPSPDDVASGERVEVRLTGFTPGERVPVTVCAVPARAGTRFCGSPAPIAHVRVGPDGTATTHLKLREGAVGTGGARCDRQTPCAVVAGGDGVLVPAIEVTFASGPGAAYDAARVALGVVVATILLALAAWLVRSTDWRKPSEAETPVMDAAPLAEL